jgi:hypothetical protein
MPCVNRLWHVSKLTRRYVLVKPKAPCKIADIMGNPDAHYPAQRTYNT